MSTESPSTETQRTDAEQLASTLRQATCTRFADVRADTTERCLVEVELTQRTIPTPMLLTIADYGEIQIQRTEGSSLRFHVSW